MPRTFVVPDIHGQLDLLERALSWIERAATSGTVVFLGDYIDRGPRSREVVERLMTGPLNGWKWICLMGNHERTMTDAVVARRVDKTWLTKDGGGQTLLSYGHPRQGKLDYSVIPESHVEWLRSRPLVHEDEHRVFVHAKVDAAWPLEEHGEETALWGLYDDTDDSGYRGKHVVHGHNPHESVRLSGRTALDVHAPGRLLLGVFDDDMPGGPVDVPVIF